MTTEKSPYCPWSFLQPLRQSGLLVMFECVNWVASLSIFSVERGLCLSMEFSFIGIGQGFSTLALLTCRRIMFCDGDSPVQF